MSGVSGVRRSVTWANETEVESQYGNGNSSGSTNLREQVMGSLRLNSSLQSFDTHVFSTTTDNNKYRTLRSDYFNALGYEAQSRSLDAINVVDRKDARDSDDSLVIDTDSLNAIEALLVKGQFKHHDVVRELMELDRTKPIPEWRAGVTKAKEALAQRRSREHEAGEPPEPESGPSGYRTDIYLRHGTPVEESQMSDIPLGWYGIGWTMPDIVIRYFPLQPKETFEGFLVAISVMGASFRNPRTESAYERYHENSFAKSLQKTLILEGFLIALLQILFGGGKALSEDAFLSTQIFSPDGGTIASVQFLASLLCLTYPVYFYLLMNCSSYLRDLTKFKNVELKAPVLPIGLMDKYRAFRTCLVLIICFAYVASICAERWVGSVAKNLIFIPASFDWHLTTFVMLNMVFVLNDAYVLCIPLSSIMVNALIFTSSTAILILWHAFQLIPDALGGYHNINQNDLIGHFDPKNYAMKNTLSQSYFLIWQFVVMNVLLPVVIRATPALLKRYDYWCNNDFKSNAICTVVAALHALSEPNEDVRKLKLIHHHLDAARVNMDNKRESENNSTIVQNDEDRKQWTAEQRAKYCVEAALKILCFEDLADNSGTLDAFKDGVEFLFKVRLDDSEATEDWWRVNAWKDNNRPPYIMTLRNVMTAKGTLHVRRNDAMCKMLAVEPTVKENIHNALFDNLDVSGKELMRLIDIHGEAQVCYNAVVLLLERHRCPGVVTAQIENFALSFIALSASCGLLLSRRTLVLQARMVCLIIDLIPRWEDIVSCKFQATRLITFLLFYGIGFVSNRSLVMGYVEHVAPGIFTIFEPSLLDVFTSSLFECDVMPISIKPGTMFLNHVLTNPMNNVLGPNDRWNQSAAIYVSLMRTCAQRLDNFCGQRIRPDPFSEILQKLKSPGFDAMTDVEVTVSTIGFIAANLYVTFPDEEYARILGYTAIIDFVALRVLITSGYCDTMSHEFTECLSYSSSSSSGPMTDLLLEASGLPTRRPSIIATISSGQADSLGRSKSNMQAKGERFYLTRELVYSAVDEAAAVMQRNCIKHTLPLLSALGETLGIVKSERRISEPKSTRSVSNAHLQLSCHEFITAVGNTANANAALYAGSEPDADSKGLQAQRLSIARKIWNDWNTNRLYWKTLEVDFISTPCRVMRAFCNGLKHFNDSRIGPLQNVSGHQILHERMNVHRRGLPSNHKVFAHYVVPDGAKTYEMPRVYITSASESNLDSSILRVEQQTSCKAARTKALKGTQT